MICNMVKSDYLFWRGSQLQHFEGLFGLSLASSPFLLSFVVCGKFFIFTIVPALSNHWPVFFWFVKMLLLVSENWHRWYPLDSPPLFLFSLSLSHTYTHTPTHTKVYVMITLRLSGLSNFTVMVLHTELSAHSCHLHWLQWPWADLKHQ